MEAIDVELSNGQKMEVLKRFRDHYRHELETVESKLRDLLTAQKEAEFLQQYIGDQAEVRELRPDPEELQVLGRRREHILKIVERLTQVTPEQPQVAVTPPAKMTRY
jgi:hypothetical protein